MIHVRFSDCAQEIEVGGFSCGRAFKYTIVSIEFVLFSTLKDFDNIDHGIRKKLNREWHQG